jgi:hypothetical protein
VHVVRGAADHEQAERHDERERRPDNQARGERGEREAREHADAAGERDRAFVLLAPARLVGKADAQRGPGEPAAGEGRDHQGEEEEERNAVAGEREGFVHQKADTMRCQRSASGIGSEPGAARAPVSRK